jgi:hypothetical protein
MNIARMNSHEMFMKSYCIHIKSTKLSRIIPQFSQKPKRNINDFTIESTLARFFPTLLRNSAWTILKWWITLVMISPLSGLSHLWTGYNPTYSPLLLSGDDKSPLLTDCPHFFRFFLDSVRWLNCTKEIKRT